MFNFQKKQFWVVGLIVTVLVFIFLFVGIRVILGNAVYAGNILAFGIYSVLMGAIASLLVFFGLKIALTAYLGGLVLGFLMMYQIFSNGMSGWGDLAGILSLMTWTVFGLAIGILIQLVYFLYKRFKKKN